MRTINRLIIHHSASPFGCVSVIRDWHLARGWRDCGYHVCILNGYLRSHHEYSTAMDGAIELGRPWEQIGAHAAGHNTNSLGLCLIGYGDRITPKQYASLKRVITMLRAMYPGIHVIGHRDVGQTVCPGLDIAHWCTQEGL